MEEDLKSHEDRSWGFGVLGFWGRSSEPYFQIRFETILQNY